MSSVWLFLHEALPISFLLFLPREARQSYALGWMEGQQQLKRRLSMAEDENPKRQARMDVRVKEAKGKEPVKERLTLDEADELLKGTTTFPTKSPEEPLDLDSLIEDEE